jgi:CheY-like chemotaxis protein/anti-sigma regulatory factor (Ser/Thr protein kinase)
MELQIDPQIPDMIVGDAKRLRQIMANLIGNAIKFTERGGVTVAVNIRKGALQGADALAITISDTGIGIPEEKKQLLFRSFSQADSSITRRYGGTGLGLAISKHLVQRMGGTIGMESEAGQGSVFSFAIPLPADAVLPPQQEQQEQEFGLGKSPNILLVEDDPAIREMIRMILSERNWQVTTAGNGREALTLWRSQPFDIILMDLQMPGMDGLETTRIIRQQEGERHIPIIALTAYARKEDEKNCLAAGMDGYLSKPLKLEQLYSTIKSHTEQTPPT